ncbi:anaerobic ribonucleoside-triphosphate reductase [Rhodoferax ferrireducens]|uniref:anaerobic ribonucleoside-triphosphate reductase n=1 Tax=Rhodoferax ferrireducens TaxID=192843 RepID=UPI000E0DA6E3|nr:anaerobic ribonucleoside-triphosphate reductase [Rhodoferax ferrireducens]
MTDQSEQQFLAQPAQTILLRDDERQRCEVWTRVMGYHRPMASFNTGKKGEFHERTYFDERRCQLADVSA